MTSHKNKIERYSLCKVKVFFLGFKEDLMTSLLSQRIQFSLNCKKIIALKIDYKIVAFFAKSYPSKVPQYENETKRTQNIMSETTNE